MKKRILTLVILVAAVVFSNEAMAQKFPPLDKSPADIATYPRRGADKVMKIVYSRPQLKGRAVSSLAKEGKMWRLGANEATEITFYKNVMFGGKSVKAGTYAMFAIPGKSEWTIILNKDLNVWGNYQYKKEQDIVRTTAKVSKNDDSVEAFSITYSKDGDVLLGWGNTVVTIPVK